MRRTLALCSAVLLFASTAHAEDALVLWGNYYLERSTRVIAPTVTLYKDAGDGTFRGTYLVDQITSASGAFTATDEPFSEYRQDISLQYTHRFANGLVPAIGVRYSHEGDYRSHGVIARLGYELSELTTLDAILNYKFDIIGQRGREGFRETLNTAFVSLGVTQVLSPQALGGVTFDSELLRGYQENPYRVEQHPRERNRYGLTGWGAYRFVDTKTSVRLEYTLGFGTWDLVGHSFDLRLTQRLLPSLEIQPEVRYHTQGGVFFVELTDNFITTDPKLRALETAMFGGRIIWTLSLLRGTALAMLADAQLHPSYYYYHQTNRYGDAHIAQLGLYIPL